LAESWRDKFLRRLQILKQPTYYNQISSMVLADTVYASFTSGTDLTPLDSQMADFRKFAMDAKNGSKTLLLSHSQVLTYTYCNTIETADDLMQWVGVTPSAYNVVGLGGIQFYRYADTGNFTVYGATGDDATAHSLHLQNMGQWMDDMPLATLPEPSVVALLPLLLMRGRRSRA
jgi:hypothetical protein